ncbi:MAG: hypothetical protein ACJAXJ_003095 [Colwellia sp.]|jgi:hypothetical protein
MPAGLITAICLLLLFVLWPFFLMDLMLLGLYKLGISPLIGLIPIPLNSGTASIGGAGTFDGIVISGFIALLLS